MKKEMNKKAPKNFPIFNQELKGPWAKVFWWGWRIGVGIDLGLIVMVLYFFFAGML